MYRRNRAKKETARIRAWPQKEVVFSFAAYKAGTTHALIVENRKTHPMVGKKMRVPVTVLDAPPMIVVGFKAYGKTPYGLRTLGEVWAEKLPKELALRIKLPKQSKTQEQLKKVESIKAGVSGVRLLVITQPAKAAVPKKKPELMEQPLNGPVEQQLSKAKEMLGKELKFKDLFKEGDAVDIFAVTKGHGFQGVIKRHGAKLQKRKTETTRKIGTLGPETPDKVLPTVPAAGQMGYHQRFSLNHYILKIGEKLNVKSGWPHYGIINGDCIVIRGTVPGPSKRLIRLRTSYRAGHRDPVEISYLSLAAKN